MLGVKIRAKVKIDGKSNYSEGGGGSVSMTAIYSADPVNENKVFTDFPPCLSLTVDINRQDTFDFFQLDKEYFLDFIPVEATP